MAAYKIVASDMDQTFLDDQHQIPQTNVDAIRRMRELGCLFVPASGRSYPSVMNSLRSLPKDLLEGSYLISYNGGCINRIGEDKPIVSHSLPFERVRTLWEYGMRLGICMHVYAVEGTLWIFNMTPEEYDYVEGHDRYIDCHETSLDFVRDIPLAKILYVLPGQNDKLHEIRAAMPDELVEGADTTYSSQRYLEFIPQGTSKGNGLLQLADYLGVDHSQTIACGDAGNDITMIRSAGQGVVVANGDTVVKEAADYVATSTCNDGVLKEVVDHFLA